MTTDQRSVILIDAQRSDGIDFDQRMLERFEHPVEVCPGPGPKLVCPLLTGERCPKFDRAHGIVFALDLDRAQHRAILRRYREIGGDDLPIRVICTPDQARRHGADLHDVEVWVHEPDVADLDGFAARVEAVDRFFTPACR